ncbi:hypothetical protein HHI36_017696, partial [Cryptolaemus montrouzieri]
MSSFLFSRSIQVVVDGLMSESHLWFLQNFAEVSEEILEKTRSNKLKWVCGGFGDSSESGDEEIEPRHVFSEACKSKSKEEIPTLRDIMNKLISMENNNESLLKQLKEQESKYAKLEKDLAAMKRAGEFEKELASTPTAGKGIVESLVDNIF